MSLWISEDFIFHMEQESRETVQMKTYFILIYTSIASATLHNLNYSLMNNPSMCVLFIA